jgi:lipoprotein-anchoring transpeptidase ErfK/SrfK
MATDADHTGRRRLTRVLVLLAAACTLVVTGGEFAAAQAVPAPAPAPPPSPFAAWPLPAGSGQGRRVVYSVGQQRVWWVESNEVVVNTYLVSGRRGTPRPGTYAVYSKSRYASSGSARMEYMIRFAWGRSLAIGFHSIPTVGGRPLQSEAQLGQPLSHGCVRQRVSDAAALWNWAPIGTRVDVVK